jgi:hypothetical protein
MVTDLILQFFGAIMDAFLSLLPAWNLQLPGDKINIVVGTVTRWNSILPISELFWCIVASSGVFIALILYYCIMWVVKRLTLSG